LAVEGSEIEINSVSVKEYIRASNAVSEITAFAESCAFEVNPDKKVDDVLAVCKILQIGTVESLDKMMETAAGRADKFFAAVAKSFLSASGDGEFENPLSVALSDTGQVYVTDTNNHRIQRFDADGNYETQWGMPGLMRSVLDRPLISTPRDFHEKGVWKIRWPRSSAKNGPLRT